MLVITTISSVRMSSLHILREDELENYFCSPICPSLCRATLVWTMISSGRISSLHILREDELENCILFLYTLCEGEGGINKIILRDGGLFTYPQGGWALELCQVLLYTTLPTWSMGSLKPSHRMIKRPELWSHNLLAKLEHPKVLWTLYPSGVDTKGNVMGV